MTGLRRNGVTERVISEEVSGITSGWNLRKATLTIAISRKGVSFIHSEVKDGQLAFFNDPHMENPRQRVVNISRKGKVSFDTYFFRTEAEPGGRNPKYRRDDKPFKMRIDAEELREVLKTGLAGVDFEKFFSRQQAATIGWRKQIADQALEAEAKFPGKSSRRTRSSNGTQTFLITDQVGIGRVEEGKKAFLYVVVSPNNVLFRLTEAKLGTPVQMGDPSNPFCFDVNVHKGNITTRRRTLYEALDRNLNAGYRPMRGKKGELHDRDFGTVKIAMHRYCNEEGFYDKFPTDEIRTRVSVATDRVMEKGTSLGYTHMFRSHGDPTQRQ